MKKSCGMKKDGLKKDKKDGLKKDKKDVLKKGLSKCKKDKEMLDE